MPWTMPFPSTVAVAGMGWVGHGWVGPRCPRVCVLSGRRVRRDQSQSCGAGCPPLRRGPYSWL